MRYPLRMFWIIDDVKTQSNGRRYSNVGQGWIRFLPCSHIEDLKRMNQQQNSIPGDGAYNQSTANPLTQASIKNYSQVQSTGGAENSQIILASPMANAQPTITATAAGHGSSMEYLSTAQTQAIAYISVVVVLYIIAIGVLVLKYYMKRDERRSDNRYMYDEFNLNNGRPSVARLSLSSAILGQRSPMIKSGSKHDGVHLMPPSPTIGGAMSMSERSDIVIITPSPSPPLIQ